MHSVGEQIERGGRAKSPADIEHQGDRLRQAVQHAEISGHRVIRTPLCYYPKVGIVFDAESPVIVARAKRKVPRSRLELLECIEPDVVVRVVRDEGLLAELVELIPERTKPNDSRRALNRRVMQPDIAPVGPG